MVHLSSSAKSNVRPTPPTLNVLTVETLYFSPDQSKVKLTVPSEIPSLAPQCLKLPWTRYETDSRRINPPEDFTRLNTKLLVFNETFEDVEGTGMWSVPDTPAPLSLDGRIKLSMSPRFSFGARTTVRSKIQSVKYSWVSATQAFQSTVAVFHFHKDLNLYELDERSQNISLIKARCLFSATWLAGRYVLKASCMSTASKQDPSYFVSWLLLLLCACFIASVATGVLRTSVLQRQAVDNRTCDFWFNLDFNGSYLFMDNNDWTLSFQASLLSLSNFLKLLADIYSYQSINNDL